MNKVGTVCFIVQHGNVLLAHIQYPDGRFLWNGIGGGVESGETPTQAVVREVSEETKMTLNQDDVRDVLTVDLPDLELHVFVADTWQGSLEIIDPTLKELRWFAFENVPYTQMHAGNDEWLPRILTLR